MLLALTSYSIHTSKERTYVRPQLEYCSPVWSPHLQTHIKLIEKVQRKFTKRLPGLYNIPYKERLEKCGLESLELRRLRNDLILMYKILFGLTCLRADNYFKLSSTNDTSRGHKFKLIIPLCKLDTFKHSFFNRHLLIWNNLPADTDFSSLSNFKRCLTTVSLNIVFNS